MRDYYLHARAIHRVSRRLIARCQETLSRRGSAERRQRQQALADGLVFFDGPLHLADRDPGPLPRRAGAAHEGLLAPASPRLRAVARPRARASRTRSISSTATFQRSPAVRDLFLDICRSWGRVGADVLARCTSSGCWARYLPEFGALTCLVQYDVYHKFSADQHSLLAVEHLEALAPGQSAESEGAAQVFNEVEKPELLMLGMLLHDIGKAQGPRPRGQGHPADPRADRRASGCRPRTARVVEFLVAHHLTMSHIAQRRDIDDPEDRSRTSRRRAGDAAAPAHALSAHLCRHARGGPRRAHALAGDDPARAVRARTPRPAHRRPRASAPAASQLAERLRRRAGDEQSRAGREGARGHGVGPLPRDDQRAAHGRAPAACSAASSEHAGRDRALPPSRSRLVRPGGRHARRAGALLADRRHAGRAAASTSCRPRSTRAATASPSTPSRSTTRPARR